MIDLFVRSMLGPLLSRVLDFYIQNSLWINSLLMVYIVLIFIGRYNYRKVLEALVQGLKDKYRGSINRKTATEIERVLNNQGVPWEAGLQNSNNPFITPPGGLTVSIKTLKSLQKFFSIKQLAVILSKQGDAQK
jgi:hypothetical protein